MYIRFCDICPVFYSENNWDGYLCEGCDPYVYEYEEEEEEEDGN